MTKMLTMVTISHVETTRGLEILTSGKQHNLLSIKFGYIYKNCSRVIT